MSRRCRGCGHPLTRPSLDGYGPVCRARLTPAAPAPTRTPTARHTGAHTPAQPELEEPMPDTTTADVPQIVAEPQMEAVHYGIPVAHIGEDGEMLALGHHPTRHVLAAFNRHARTFVGIPNLADDFGASAADVAEDISQKWAVIRKPDPELDDDPDYAWMADWADPDAPDARPVTLFRP